MAGLEWRINSVEIDRAIFAVRNYEMLPDAIEKIRIYRKTGQADDLGPETVLDVPEQKNNRILCLVCFAGFGWTLINQKTRSGNEGYYYTVGDGCEPLLEAALSIPVKHRDFGTSLTDYLNWISDGACLPRDCRP